MSIALLNQDKTVWRLVYDTKQNKSYFHPLSLVDGTVLTDLRPPDHAWHYAGWFSWTFINGLNYWEEDRATGLPSGVSEITGVKVDTANDFSATIEMTLSYHPPGKVEVLSEKRVLTVSAPDAAGSYHIDWRSKFAAKEQKVVLNRTPLPGQPGGAGHGGYAGLSIRSAKACLPWTFRDSEGRINDSHGKQARWLSHSGSLAGGTETENKAGLTMFDHPDNVGYPSRWFTVKDMPYFSPAVIFSNPLTLDPGQKLDLKYRILVQARQESAAQLDRQHAQFAAANTNRKAFLKATESAAIAGATLSKTHRWLHEVALPKIDAKTGLYIADGRWNYRDTAADCYPFLTWAAWAVDRDVLNGPVRAILHAEQKLCNHLDRIPVPYDHKKGQTQPLSYEEMVFQASEYVKDGLIAIVEVTGKDEWFDRMRAIEDDLWKHARVETPFGNIPSNNIEVNGEQIQALSRLYTMTGDARYLTWAERLADHYFSQEDFVPNRLRDHGCEIIGGLGLLLSIESRHNTAKAKLYATQLKIVFDKILEGGCNEDGMMFNEIVREAFGDRRGAFSDGWGYNYVGFLCYDMATGTETYHPHVRKTLTALSKSLYRDYPWEGSSIDGWADSVEGGLYLLNRIPVAEGMTWADRETAAHIARTAQPDHMWGTMKLQANGVRTALMHALMHTQGITSHPWQQGLELGAALDGENGEDSLAVVVHTRDDYEGHLEFDIPRHRLYLGFREDWPRMNTLPEWFTVEPDKEYSVRNIDTGETNILSGRQMHNGVRIAVSAGNTVQLSVSPRK